MPKYRHSRFEIDKAAGTLGRERALHPSDIENKHREIKKAMDNANPEEAAERYLATPGSHPYDRIRRGKRVVAAVTVAGGLAAGALLGRGMMSDAELQQRDAVTAEEQQDINTTPQPGHNNAVTAVAEREAQQQGAETPPLPPRPEQP